MLSTTTIEEHVYMKAVVAELGSENEAVALETVRDLIASHQQQAVEICQLRDTVAFLMTLAGAHGWDAHHLLMFQKEAVHA